jgi:hypothetical protein
MTTSAEIADWREGLVELPARIAHRFGRATARRAKRYLAGLLDRVERKNGWPVADIWESRGRRACSGTEHLGNPTGVLIVDETGFRKKGSKSVGV